MKLRPFIAHTSIFASGLVAGLLVASSYFVFDVLPSTQSAVLADPPLIKLSKESEPVSYDTVIQQAYLGNLYLRNPIYFFKRQEGYDMLADLANRGYSNSAMSLYFYEIRQAFQGPYNPKVTKKHYDQAYHWAMLAANQGLYVTLLMMIKNEGLGQTKDITKELAMLEDWAKKSPTNATALGLHEYYNKQGEKEKAAKWLETAKKIQDEHRPKPACTTITPWRGW